MKADETFCLTCSKTYKRRDNDIFGYLCLSYNEKEIKSIYKISHRKPKILYHKGCQRKNLILKQQEDIVLEGMTILCSTIPNFTSIAHLTSWITKNRNFPYANRGNEALYPVEVSENLVRTVVNKLIKQNKLKKIYIYKGYNKYTLV